MTRILYLFALILIVAAIHSCRTTSEVSVNGGKNKMTADVSEGKSIYIKDCAKCHEAKVVEDYTSVQWENILARMVIKAQLDETQSRQVKSYIDWELIND